MKGIYCMDSHAAIVEDWRGKWGWMKTYTYGGMSIHLPPILVFTRVVLTRNHITFPKTLRRTGSYGSWSVWKSGSTDEILKTTWFFGSSVSPWGQKRTHLLLKWSHATVNPKSLKMGMESTRVWTESKDWDGYGWIKIHSLSNMKKIPSPWYEDESLVFIHDEPPISEKLDRRILGGGGFLLEERGGSHGEGQMAGAPWCRDLDIPGPWFGVLGTMVQPTLLVVITLW